MPQQLHATLGMENYQSTETFLVGRCEIRSVQKRTQLLDDSSVVLDAKTPSVLAHETCMIGEGTILETHNMRKRLVIHFDLLENRC